MSSIISLVLVKSEELYRELRISSVATGITLPGTQLSSSFASRELKPLRDAKPNKQNSD